MSSINSISIGAFAFYLCLMLVFIIMAVHYLKSDKPSKTGIKGMISGTISLIVIHFWGGYIGLYIPLNLFTTVISLVLGAPAVIIMTLLEKFIY